MGEVCRHIKPSSVLDNVREKKNKNVSLIYKDLYKIPKKQIMLIKKMGS